MTVGFQSFNDGGTFQIDGVFPQFVFRRKQVVTFTDIIGDTDNQMDRPNQPYYVGAIDVANDEIVALNGNDYSMITATNGGKMTIATNTIRSAANVNAYVFGPVAPKPGNFGFQVFNSAGTLVFDAAQKPLRMVAFPSGEGTFNVGSGRYAVITSNQWLEITSEIFSNSNFDLHHEVRTGGMSKEINGQISIQNVKFYDVITLLNNGEAPNVTWTPRTTNQHIIVDVTNY